MKTHPKLSFGSFWNPRGCSWALMDVPGSFWASSGCSWALLGTPGHFWLLLGTPATPGSFWTISGCFLKWIRQWGEERQRASAAPGHLWMFLEASGPVLAAPGHSWALLAAPGHSWRFWKLLDHFWLLLGAPGHFWKLPGRLPSLTEPKTSQISYRKCYLEAIFGASGWV